VDKGDLKGVLRLLPTLVQGRVSIRVPIEDEDDDEDDFRRAP